jgi:uncharacterized protein YqeY
VTIIEQLTEDMKASMKAGEPDRTGTLRLLRGAVKNEAIKLGHDLDEAEVLKVLQREAKQRRDSVEAYQKADRMDLSAHEEAELAIIAQYLPEPMSREELAAVVAEVVAELKPTGPAQMGQVMGEVMKRTAGRAEGGAVSQLVREALSA